MSEAKHTNEKRHEEPPAGGMAVDDIYFVLFRQKWKILSCTALGVVAALALVVLKPAQYQSEAELLIKYVVDVRSPAPNGNDGAVTKSPDAGGAGIIDTEVKILTSLDTIQQVVANIGAENILGKAGGGSDTNAAAALVLKNVATEPPTKDSVITITYQHPDKEMARAILAQLIAAYLKKHVDMHQPVGIYGEVLNGETERLRSDLAKTEQQLREAKQQAGVISLDDSKKGLSEQISKIKEDIVSAEADLAEHRTALKESSDLSTPGTDSTNAAAEIPADDVREYRNACTRLNLLLQKEQDDLNKYPDTSPFMQQTRQLIIEAEQHKMKLEEANPKLATIVVVAPVTGPQTAGSPLDLAAESLIVKKLESKTNSLNMQLAKVEAEAQKIEDMEAPILDLQRRKESQENNLKYFLNSMEQNRINAELGAGSGTEGISVVQAPSPALKKHSKKFNKFLGAALAGGLFGGLALAFFIEKVLDRSVRRPGEIEKKLNLPLYISIPDFSPNGTRVVAAPAKTATPLLLKNGENGEALAVATTNGSSGGGGAVEIPTWDRRHSLHRFFEGLRDRLIVNFEIKNLTHKPKLVAVTSCNKGAGVSTIAAGLAASLSETGDGNVLLVDMNFEQGMAQQFRQGKPGCGLDDALESETMNNALVGGNLYVAAEQVGNDKLPRVLPRRFASLMPKLKASDYDYIIFDMPPVSQTSMTPRLAGLMDMVLLVIESEKTSSDVVKRASSLLAESKANVSTVLNKTRNYIPAQLHQEFLDDV